MATRSTCKTANVYTARETWTLLPRETSTITPMTEGLPTPLDLKHVHMAPHTHIHPHTRKYTHSPPYPLSSEPSTRDVFERKRYLDEFCERWCRPAVKSYHTMRKTRRRRRRRPRPGSAYLLLLLALGSMWTSQGLVGLLGKPGGIKRTARDDMSPLQCERVSVDGAMMACFLLAAATCAQLREGPLPLVVAGVDLGSRSVTTQDKLRAYMRADPAYQLGKLYDAPCALQALLKHTGYTPAWLPASCSTCIVRAVDKLDNCSGRWDVWL